MRLKTFSAATMPQAMAAVKKAMGNNAVIMASKTDAATGHVILTAAVDDDDFSPANAASPPQAAAFLPAAAPQVGVPEDTLDTIADAMEYHSLPRRLASKILRYCDDSESLPAATMLQMALERTLVFSTYTHNPQQVLALIGTPGAGKTVTAAKLATRARLAREALHVITTDTHKAGGIEQLESLLQVLGSITHTASDAASLAALVQLTRASGKVLVDTPGICPFDDSQCQQLRALLQHCDGGVLVLPAGLDSMEAAELAATFAGMTPLHGLMVTRLDTARRLGSIIAAADAARLPLWEAGTSASIPDGLQPLTASELANRLLESTASASFKHSA